MTRAVRAQDGERARNAGAWTQEKLMYLRKYASAFMKAMAPKRAEGKWDQLVFIDLLSGPGIDIDRRSRKEFHGSPLIALDIQPRFDRLLLGDLDPKNVGALRARILEADQARVDLKCRDCHQRARDIVASFPRNTLGLAFVDPEGFEVRYELFHTLSTKPIDILFLFPSGIGIARNLPMFARQSHSPMDDLWGDRTWRDTSAAKALAGKTLTPLELERFDQSWVVAFRNRVAKLGYAHHDSVGPLRNEQNSPMYHLLFFSKHQAGQTLFRGISQIDAHGQRSLKYE